MQSFSAFPAWSRDRSLDEVLAVLEHDSSVAAVLLLGSTAKGLTDSSDYDLLVVMNSGEPFGFEYTFVDGRETDIVLLIREEVERILALNRWSEPGERDVVSWITEARVAFSRDDFLADAPAAAKRIHSASVPSSSDEVYYRWV
jgi:predicted nucleotidyltransferase